MLFDGLKALKNARIARGDEWFCKDISTKFEHQGKVFVGSFGIKISHYANYHTLKSQDNFYDYQLNASSFRTHDFILNDAA